MQTKKQSLLDLCSAIFYSHFNSKANLVILSANAYDRKDLISDVAIKVFFKRDDIKEGSEYSYIYKTFRNAIADLSKKLSLGTIQVPIYIRFNELEEDSEPNTVKEKHLKDYYVPCFDIDLSFLNIQSSEFYEEFLLNVLDGKTSKFCAEKLGMGTSTFKRKKGELISFIKENYTPPQFKDSLTD